MNNEQIASAVRNIVAYVLAFAAGKGWISTNDIAQLTPLLGAVALLAYEWWKRRDVALVQAAGQVNGAVVAIQPSAAPAVQAAAVSRAPENTGVVPIQELQK